ncbi:MAG: hydrolase [Candidatus Tectimicrobiota bacterium]|nr:MAG: hydrolase [Candidatus Tectomicrobia bacterium]
MPFTAVICDLDGLLLDTERLARWAWQRAAADWHYTLSDELYLTLVGRTEADSEQLLRQAFGPAFPLRAVQRRAWDYMQQAIATEGLRLRPGAAELLAFLEARGIARAVATSSEQHFALQKLRGSGLHAYFATVVTGSEVPRGKPAPDLFLRAAQQLGRPPQQCLVLEDAAAGVQAAHAAGMAVIMVPDLVPPTAAVAALAHRVLPSLVAVRAYLERLFASPAER